MERRKILDFEKEMTNEIARLEESDARFLATIDEELGKLTKKEGEGGHKKKVPTPILTGNRYAAMVFLIYIALVSAAAYYLGLLGVILSIWPGTTMLNGVLKNIPNQINERNEVWWAAAQPPLTFAELIALDGCEIQNRYCGINVIKVKDGYYHLTPLCALILTSYNSVNCDAFLEYFKKLNKFEKAS